MRSEAAVRGESFYKKMEHGFLAINRWLGRFLPEDLNPIAQMGAVANTNFVISVISGILLLFWYSPSLSGAYSSLESLASSPYLAELMRSLHRYSSDICMLFVILHGLQTVFARKFGRSRWLAWVSGIIMLGMLWFDGWTGYWLVWDERASLVAKGTAKVIDLLPLFGDLFSRSFITDDTLNSLLFFVVFFIHMLIPLPMAVFIWVHIMRLNQSRFFTNQKLTLAILSVLVIMSLLYPATSAGPAKMQEIPQDLTFDYFYLFPLYFTENISGGTIWMLMLLATTLLIGFPWWFARQSKAPSSVIPGRCNGCEVCFNDCPYNAISMVPSDGKFPLVAQIHADKCTSCGVCAGSCESSGIFNPELAVHEVRDWLKEALGNAPENEKPYVAFLCSNSAGANLQVDSDGSCAKLPGYKVIPVPCAGWVHMRTIERAIHWGAPGVLISACSTDPMCRHGNMITADRLQGTREPAMRHSKVGQDQITYLQHDRSQERSLLAEAAAFRKGLQTEPARLPAMRIRTFIVSIILAGVIGLGTLGLSDLAFAGKSNPEAELIISFKHTSNMMEATPDTSNQDDLLPHMRGASSTSRSRVPVRMMVSVDNQVVIHSTYEPEGLFKDGSCIVLEKLQIEPGLHTISIRIDDTQDESNWNYTAVQELQLKPALRQVILFDSYTGFKWY